jgi:DNA-binding Xre family transcriptional regulator
MARPKKKSVPARAKAPFRPLSPERRREIAAQLTDDVLAKLVEAFFEVVQQEAWGKRDLAAISGMNETAIGHILSGRRKNLKLETIAILTRAMKTRPELILHDLRPKNNNVANLSERGPQSYSAVGALKEVQFKQSTNELGPSLARSQLHSGFLHEPEAAY